MKKKVILLIISLCLLALVGGCKKKVEEDPNGAPTKKPYTASKYVTLGEYKGVAVSVDKYTISDADIDSMIKEDLMAKATFEEVTDRPVQKGDTVNIDFEGLKDGVAFEGGTAQGYDLEIGSGTFIPGFEEGLIDAKIGDKVAIDVTFPEDYQAPDLAGQPVVFNVTVNSIKVAIVPELTEEYVKENTEYDSIAAYRDAKRTSLESYSEQYNQNTKSNTVIQQVISNATVKEVPKNLMNYYMFVYGNYNEQMINYRYNQSVQEYMAANNITQKVYDEQINTAAETLAKREMIEKAIAEAEGFKITEEDYKQLLPQYLTDNGLDSEETLKKYETKERTMEQMLMQKVEKFIVEQAVVTEKPVSTETTPTPAP